MTFQMLEATISSTALDSIKQPIGLSTDQAEYRAWAEANNIPVTDEDEDDDSNDFSYLGLGS